MYHICVITQYVGIIIVLIGVAYMLHQWPSRPQVFMLFLGLAVLVDLVGYLFEITSETMGEALLATKFSYLGKVYIPLLAFLFVLYYCKIKVAHALVIILTVIHTAELVLVMTCEYHTMFYKQLGFSEDGLLPHLLHERGVAYVVFMILNLCYGVTVFAICVSQYRKVRQEEKKKEMYLLIMVLCPTFGLVLYLSGLTKGYDTTTVCYVLSGIVLLILILRYDFLDAVHLAKNYVVENLSDGLVVLGNQEQFVYANTPALLLFPALNSETYDKVIEYLRRYTQSGDRMHIDERVYIVSEREIFQNRTLRGKMIYFHEVTDSYNYTTKLETEVREKTKELLGTKHSLIVSLANMVEARDGVTGLHIKYTSAYVEIIARALQAKPKYSGIMTDSYVTALSEAAPLHDIGKISIEDAILRKEGALTAEELQEIHSHSVLGAQIIDSVLAEVGSNDYLVSAREMAYYHHERWDGSGYPAGLKGEEIPLSARIMAIADVYDALRSERSYKKACSKEEAREIIVEQSGKQFDPDLVEVFLEHLQEIEAVK